MSTFRSVTPQEDIPNDSNGFLSIRGSFAPRFHGLQNDEIQLPPFWTRASFLKHLESVFKGKNITLLPFPAEEVIVEEEEQPFKGIRLVFASPKQAMFSLLHSRKHALTASLICQNIDLVEHNWAKDHPNPTFGQKVLQISMITTQPMQIEGAWPRASQPKFRRLIKRPREDAELMERLREETRFLFIDNILQDRDRPLWWSNAWVVAQAIRATVAPLTDGPIEVFAAHGTKLHKYCHVGCANHKAAQELLRALQEKQLTWSWKDANNESHQALSAQLFVDYAALIDRHHRPNFDGIGEPSRSACTSSTDDVSIPGLHLVPDYVSEDEENALVAVLTGPQAPWAPPQKVTSHEGSIKRRVQHYGYVFDYQTANVLRDRSVVGADCPPMPAVGVPDIGSKELEQLIREHVDQGRGWDVFGGIVERIRRTEVRCDGMNILCSDINQLTVNEYNPGVGIGSHIDTVTAFGDDLLSLSLSSDTVMEFRQVSTEEGEQPRRKLVFLPRRSLLFMAGDARYKWEHMIVSRMTDTHCGKIIRRGKRISLTLRTALGLDGNPLPLICDNKYPLVWGHAENGFSPLATPLCEKKHVHAVYDAIATQWHHTRGRRGVLWPGATTFLRDIPIGSIVADIGCGDGKYFPAIWEAGCYVIGTDISLPLLETSRNVYDEVPDSRLVSEKYHHLRNRPAVAAGDCMSLPLQSKSCDAAICIAVLHHLSTVERRTRCIEELARVVKKGGLINIQAWAMEQEDSSRRKFASNDVFVPFNAQPKHLKIDETVGVGTEHETKSNAEVYSRALDAEYDDEKGLVVFKRYCHLYRKGELEHLVDAIPSVEVVDSGFETGNYFMILRVL